MKGKKKILAIIPVRGGSKGIPRKNSRLLVGKPLLSYAITTCLRSKYVDEVYVTTESPQLEEIAYKYGAKVIERSQKLSEDDVALDEVVVDAVRRVEKKEKKKFDLIVSMQATSPLVSNKSLDNAIRECMREGVDTVVSVVNDSHLRWSYDEGGNVVSLFTKRVNRQQLPGIFKETGGFVICKRSVLNKKTRFGKKVSLYEVGKEEAVDIDDRYDWWLAERSLLRKKICFHVIGNRKNGIGHIYRALSLADRIMDHEIHFVVSKENDLAIKKIQSQFYDLTVCPKGKEAETILNYEPDIVINDILNTSPLFMKKLKAKGIPTINFEDLGEGSLFADVVINALYDYHPYLKKEKVFHGIDYCCLRDEFLYTEPKKYSNKVNNILILFGGTDPENLTERTLQWLSELKGKWSITVICGLGYPHEAKIKRIARRSSHKIKVIKDAPIISKYMREADIAVTAAGRTLFELTSLGVPMIVIPSSKRELSHCLVHNSFGLVSLGMWKDVSKKDFHNTVLDLINSKLLRFNMRKALLKENVHQGIENVLSIINSVAQKVKNLRAR